jgi:excisionase family DNA binding protein
MSWTYAGCMAGMLNAGRPNKAVPTAGVGASSRARSGAHAESSAAPDEAAPGAIFERLACTVAEAATILGIGRDLLYDEIRTGRLRSKKAGARRIIGRHHLLEWLDGDQREPRKRAS